MIDLSTHPLQPRSAKKLLLIEDDASVVESLRLILKSDYEVHSESTVAEGLRHFHDLHPSLVVLDLRLPDGEGLEVLREIRRVDAHTPVVVFTGYASMRTVEESLRLGASDYLHKPLDGFALKTRINQLLEPGRRPTAGQSSPCELPDVEGELAALKVRAYAYAMFLHDIASPAMTALSSAHYLCELIERELPKDKNALEVANLLMNSLGFMSGLFQQNAAIECLSSLPVTKVKVDNVVDLALTLAQAKAKSCKVLVSVRITNPNDTICVNRFALARVLLNLLHNAIEAVAPETGQVTLTADTGSDFVEFCLVDNGPGIPTEIQERIFEPEFTTKKSGTGLGLYISAQLIAGMGGTLTLRSQPGFGCCFSVRIPLPR